MTPAQLKALRERLGITQAKVAQRIGSSQATVSRWERGLVPLPEPASRLLDMLYREERKEA